MVFHKKHPGTGRRYPVFDFRGGVSDQGNKPQAQKGKQLEQFHRQTS